jgi:hypothetical protein
LGKSGRCWVRTPALRRAKAAYHPEGIGNLGQQTHNNEFGGTDRECTERECQKGGNLLNICGPPLYVANVSAARRSVPMRGRTPTALRLRIPMQLLIIGLTWWATQA